MYWKLKHSLFCLLRVFVSSVCTCPCVSVCVRVCVSLCACDCPASRFAASSSGATALAARQTAVSPTRATAPWSTPATTRSPCAWTTSRVAALARSASTSTPPPTCRPRLRPPNTRPTRQLWLRKLLPQLQPWWEYSPPSVSRGFTAVEQERHKHTSFTRFLLV